ncbi:EI24 domain-containing protein [Agrococcus casei]|uniref:EI24 domain-containing protein n=1 Tax=Agrococcus casei TaxID=343512 RepID=UPI003F8F114A
MSEIVGKSRSAAGEFFRGVSFMWRGLRWLVRHPGLTALGAVPPLVVGAVFLGLMIALLFNLNSLVEWMTPFVSGWDDWLITAFRVLVAAMLVAGATVLFVLTFSALSLAIGAPVYDAISAAVDKELGVAEPAAEQSVMASIGKTIGDAVKLLLIALPISLAVFLISLVPFVGGVLGAVFGAFAGGRALALELMATPMDARDVTLGIRRKLLADSRAKTMGFGVGAYLLFLIPLVAVIAMPAASAGATLLTRELRGEPIS